MAKEKIDSIVTEPVVVVHDPKPQELHKPLGGSKAFSGSSAGREAKPKGIRQGSNASGQGG